MIRTAKRRQIVSAQCTVRSTQGEGVSHAGKGASVERPAVYLEPNNCRSQTKHFQTLFWTPEVRLVDCPGLVMPNFVPMESQVRPPTARSGFPLSSPPTLTDRAPSPGSLRDLTYLTRLRSALVHASRRPAPSPRAHPPDRAPRARLSTARGSPHLARGHAAAHRCGRRDAGVDCDGRADRIRTAEGLGHCESRSARRQSCRDRK